MHTDRHNVMKVWTLATGLCCGAVFAGDPPEYEVEVIPGPWCGIFGYEPAFGKGINDLGNICGYNFDCNNDNEPFFWSPETGRVALDVPPTTLRGRALDLNDQDEIIGWCDHSQPNAGRYGFVYHDGEFTSLGTFPNSVFNEARAINESGDITGFAIDTADTGYLRALLWRNGQTITLDLPLGPNQVGNDINDQMQITGWMGDAPHTTSHAFIWHNGKVSDLGVIPGGFTGQGIAINNLGDVAVQGLTLDDNDEIIVRSFLWRDGQWIDLGVLPGFDETLATDVNDAGQVIGRCDMLDSTVSRPFLWQDGAMWDLNELWVSDDQELIGIGLPWALNSSGQIIVQGAHQEFGSVAVRLTPLLPPIGDLDGDGVVGASDLLILLASWGPCANCKDCPADLDDNCVVGASDLLILLSNWG